MAELILRSGRSLHVKATAEEAEKRLCALCEYVSIETHGDEARTPAGYMRQAAFVEFERPPHHGTHRDPVRVNVMAVDAIVP